MPSPFHIINGQFTPLVAHDEYIDGPVLTDRTEGRFVSRLRLHRSECCFCGCQTKGTAVRLIPKSRGGIRSIHNVGLACQRCEVSRQQMTAAEYSTAMLRAAVRMKLRLAGLAERIPEVCEYPPGTITFRSETGPGRLLPVLHDRSKLPEFPADFEPDWLGAVGRGKLRTRLMEADPTCTFCGRRITAENASLDHRIPRGRGGSDAAPNLTLCCHHCNKQKGARTDDEFLCDRMVSRRPAEVAAMA